MTASTVQRLRTSARPRPPAASSPSPRRPTCRTSATGSVLDGLDRVAQALVNRSKGFPRQFGIEVRRCSGMASPRSACPSRTT